MYVAGLCRPPLVSLSPALPSGRETSIWKFLVPPSANTVGATFPGTRRDHSRRESAVRDGHAKGDAADKKSRWGRPRTQLTSWMCTPDVRHAARLRFGRPPWVRHCIQGHGLGHTRSFRRTENATAHLDSAIPPPLQKFETRMLPAHPWLCLFFRPRRLLWIPSAAWTFGTRWASRSRPKVWARALGSSLPLENVRRLRDHPRLV